MIYIAVVIAVVIAAAVPTFVVYLVIKEWRRQRAAERCIREGWVKKSDACPLLRPTQKH